MQTSVTVSRKLLLFLVLACGLTSGCAEIAHTRKDREAIEAVGQKLEREMESLKGEKANSPQQARRLMAKLYDVLLQTDVSACPEDFRRQYQRVVTSAREMQEAVHEVPADLGEYFVHLLEESNSTNPDVFGEKTLNQAKAKYEAFTFELQELSAIARSHGADWE